MTLTLISFLGFTALVAVISWWKTRRDDLSQISGYFLAGRSLSWIVIAGSLFLTNISAEQLTGLNFFPGLDEEEEPLEELLPDENWGLDTVVSRLNDSDKWVI